MLAFGPLGTDAISSDLPTSNGSQSATLGSLTAVAAAVVIVAASASQALAPLRSNVTDGLAAQTLASVASSATASVIVSATQSQTLAALSGTASGVAIVSASAPDYDPQYLSTLQQSVSGTVLNQGSAAQTLASISNAAAVGPVVAASASQTLGALTQDARSYYRVIGNQTLAALTQYASSVEIIRAFAVQRLAGLSQAATALRDHIGSASQTLDGISQQATGRAFWHLPDCGWIRPSGRAIDLLLAHLPIGAAWLGFRIPDKILNRLIGALARVYDDAWAMMCKVAAELDPRTTIDMMPEWETALSLPDPCLPSAATIEERRGNVLFRLAKRRWTTAQDWKDLAGLFGLTIEVTPGWYVQRPALFGDYSQGYLSYTFPLRFDIFPKLGRFRVYVDITNVAFHGFEYGAGEEASGEGFPIPFGEAQPRLTAFQCLLERVCPANVVIVWNEFPKRNHLTGE